MLTPLGTGQGNLFSLSVHTHATPCRPRLLSLGRCLPASPAADFRTHPSISILAVCFINNFSFNPLIHDLVVGIGPGFQMRNLGSERLSNLPEVTQPAKVRARRWIQVYLTSKPGFVFLIKAFHRLIESSSWEGSGRSHR